MVQGGEVRVVGLDPGFASLGYVIAEIPRGMDDLVFVEAGCVITAKDNSVSAATDLFTRAQLIARACAHNFERGDAIDFVCVEGMSYPRHTQAAVKLGCAHGVLAALVTRWGDPEVYIEQPQRIRKNVCGVLVGRTPTEEDVHKFLLGRYPELAQLMVGNRKDHRPHMLDAAACVVSAFREGKLG